MAGGFTQEFAEDFFEWIFDASGSISFTDLSSQLVTGTAPSFTAGGTAPESGSDSGAAVEVSPGTIGWTVSTSAAPVTVQNDDAITYGAVAGGGITVSGVNMFNHLTPASGIRLFFSDSPDDVAIATGKSPRIPVSNWTISINAS